MEQFKVIENYETYKISNFGYIIDLRTGKKIKTHFNTNGYEMINLRNPEGQKLFILHRLVALHFIEKIDNKNEVDHIDRNKKNNHFSNLRWADDFIQSQNRDKMKNTKLNEKFISLEYKKNSEIPIRYKIQIIRNKKRLFCKSYRCSKYTLEEVIEIRNNAVIEYLP